jgi:hypothetical protein
MAGKAMEMTTNVTPTGLSFIGLISLLILTLRRERIFIPLFIGAILLPMSEHLVVAGVNMFYLRVLIIVSLIRLIMRSEIYLKDFNAIDKLLCFFVLSMILIYTLRVQTFSALINRIGFAGNVLGTYFIFRSITYDIDDVNRFCKLLVYISTFLAVSMIIENIFRINIFFILGRKIGVVTTDSGGLRCAGPFGHPISAGIFGASMLPLFMNLFWQGDKTKKIGIVGMISATIIVGTSGSSTSILAYFVSVIGLIAWLGRKYIRQIIWSGFFMLIVLHLIMKAPVWSLIQRSAVIDGSSAYHRYFLVDQFIKRFSEWWLLGIDDTSYWAHIDVQLWDVSNYIVRIGVDGGLITLGLFFLIIFTCFQSLIRSLEFWANDIKMQKCVWTIGVSLFVHLVSFIGFSYWDQIFFIFYFLICTISMTDRLREKGANATVVL